MKPGERLRLLLAVISWGGVFAGNTGSAQTRESLAGAGAARALEMSVENEPYALRYGPVRANLSGSLGVNYTDNVFYTEQGKDDIMIEPDVSLDTLYPISPLNALRLSLGVSYQWYLKNSVLNADAPLLNPGSQLQFNLFVGDFHLQAHDQFSYQEDLFINSFAGGEQQFYNFNSVGTFERFDNKAGFDATWDLNRMLVTAGYDHENFFSTTPLFEYLNRSSEWFNAGAGYFLGDHLQSGLEGRLSLHTYDQETVLNNHWSGRVGPFVEADLMQGIKVRAGAGYDLARYDAAALGNSDYDTYYAYGTISQRTRLFSHSITAGHEHLLGDNANNLRTTYVRYAITSPIVAHMDLGANFAVNFAEEYGGPSGFDERFTYYDAGVTAGYQINQHWRAELGYEFESKDSDLAMRNFDRNRVTLRVTWNL